MTRKAILVLGMHRSGTSALAGILVKLGVAAPRTLVPPAIDNPRGFWESAAVCKFNNRLLREAGTDWDLWSRVNIDAVAPPAIAAFEQEFAALLHQEFGDAPIVGIKDPRICRLAPFWIRNLLASDVSPRLVLIIRHPIEVAQSLARRNGLRIEHGLLLWLRHVLESEAETRETPRIIVRYEDVLTDWREVAARVTSELGLEWPVRTGNTDTQIDEFVTAALRHHYAHHAAPPVAAMLAKWTEATWVALQALVVEGDTIEARSSLDAVRAQFDSVSPIFEGVLDTERTRSRAEWHQQLLGLEGERSRRSQLEHEIVDYQQEIGKLQKKVEDAAAECDRLQQALASSTSEHLELRAQLTFRMEELTQWSDWMIKSLRVRAEEAERQLTDLRDSFSWRATALPRRVAGAWLRSRRRGVR